MLHHDAEVTLNSMKDRPPINSRLLWKHCLYVKCLLYSLALHIFVYIYNKTDHQLNRMQTTEKTRQDQNLRAGANHFGILSYW